MRTNLLPLLLLLACDDYDLEAKDGIAYGCDENVISVDIMEVSSLGFSASDMLAVAEGARSSTLRYVDGGETLLTLDASYTSGAARFINSTPKNSTPESECEDRVELDVVVHFSTEDGVFNETLNTTLSASSLEEVWFNAALNLESMGGTFNVDDYSTATDYDTREVWVDGWFGPDSTTMGEIAGEAAGGDDCSTGETCSAWVEAIEVGSWGE